MGKFLPIASIQEAALSHARLCLWAWARHALLQRHVEVGGTFTWEGRNALSRLEMYRNLWGRGLRKNAGEPKSNHLSSLLTDLNENLHGINRHNCQWWLGVSFHHRNAKYIGSHYYSQVRWTVGIPKEWMMFDHTPPSYPTVGPRKRMVTESRHPGAVEDSVNRSADQKLCFVLVNGKTQQKQHGPGHVWWLDIDTSKIFSSCFIITHL